jgi:hypothetical protein
MYTVEINCNVMKGTEYFVSLYTSVVITEEYNVMVNSEELIGTTECMALKKRCCSNRCRYKRVLLYMKFSVEEFQSQCLYVHRKSNIEWPGIEPGPPW